MRVHDRRRRIMPALSAVLSLLLMLVCAAASARVDAALGTAHAGAVQQPRDAAGLLAQYAPVLRYDAHELFYADSPGVATDNPEATLRAGGPSGPVVASRRGPAQLSLSYLGGQRYADGRPVGRDDTLVGPSVGTLRPPPWRCRCTRRRGTPTSSMGARRTGVMGAGSSPSSR